MKFLNLDKEFNPYRANSEQLIDHQSFVFSGGEPHIKLVAAEVGREPVMITQRVNSFNDLGLICLAVDALRRMEVAEISLFIPYFPAARQDRVMVPGEPLSVKIYADIINQLGLKKVLVFDPHSEVVPALVHNIVAVANYRFVQQVIEQIGEEVVLVSPDGGALKKIYKVSEALGGLAVVECSKHRDVRSGKLLGFKVYADDLEGKTCLIVDDICDGGGTFLGLAQELKHKNAGKIYLAVSHGIFSKGTAALKAEFSGIFATDSFQVVEGVQTILLQNLLQ
jgi:ribose-phosphate pyrophosphokinase